MKTIREVFMFLNVLASIDIAFYIILGIAVLFGFIRGFKKTIFTLIVMGIFYVIFFVTLDMMVDVLWKTNMGFLGSVFGNLDPALSNFESFENDYQLIVQTLFNNAFDFSQPEMDALAVGLMQFVVKIIWAIMYFTVVLVVYKLITALLRGLFVKSKNKKHLLGGIVGAVNGAMAVFVTLIVLGGSISFLESASLLISDDGSSNQQTLSFEPRPNILELNYSLLDQNIEPLAESDPMLPQETKDMIDDLIDNYHSNIIVKIANGINVTSTFNEDVEVPLHINLFDRIISFNYEDQNIALRHELSMFSKAYDVVRASEYGDTGNITDIKGEDIRGAFVYLNESMILSTALPIAIKYFAEANEISLSVSDSQLYDYDYQEEVERLSNILAGMFDILNEQTQSIDEDGQTVTIDGDFVRDIFLDVSNSQVILLLSESFLLPTLEEGEGTLSQLIEIPDGFSLSDEYLALGNIIAELVDNDISIKTIESADFNVLLESFAQIDITVLLESDILTEALINILNNETDMEGLDVLTIPSGLTWRSTDTVTGELEYMLLAVKEMVVELGGADFETFDIDSINQMSNTSIDVILDSYILRATISDTLDTLELGSFNLIVPDDALDAQNYYTKTELSDLITAIKSLYDDLETFDLDTLYAMDTSDYNLLFESLIIRSTITNQIETINLGSNSLVIPDDVYDAPEYLSKTELLNLMNAISLIVDDLDTFTIDVIYTLDNTELTTLFDSNILQATVSDIILDFALLNQNPSSISLVVPAFFRENITVDGTTVEQIEKQELIDMITAFNSLGLSGFDGSIDPSLITSSVDYNTILNSGSMHVSIDNMLDSNSNLDVPVLAQSTSYDISNIIIKTEIIDLINAFTEISTGDDITEFDISFSSIASLNETSRNIIIESMIVRNMITPDIESADASDPLFTLQASDYVEGNTSLFLTVDGVNRYITHIESL
jgi:hypothetical protein